MSDLHGAGRARPPERHSLIQFRDARAVREEIAAAIPFYAGIEWLSKVGDALQWGGPLLCEGGHAKTPNGCAQFDAARGEIDVLYSAGGNFLETLPEPDFVREAPERVPLRVHQDIVVSPQMLVEPADTVVLLPPPDPLRAARRRDRDLHRAPRLLHAPAGTRSARHWMGDRGMITNSAVSKKSGAIQPLFCECYP